MNTVSGFGPLDALARAPIAAPVQALGPAWSPGAWFDTAPGAQASLNGEVEFQAQGLGVTQHAERVLGALLGADHATR